MYASNKSGKKLAEATTDGSGNYSLKVPHSGSFTLTAEDPKGNYKKSPPKTVKTTQASHTQDFGLEYGRKTTLTGIVSTLIPNLANVVGATVTIKVEGIDTGKNATTDRNGNYSITFQHPGQFTVNVSAPGKTAKNHTLSTTKGSTKYNVSIS